MSQQMTPVTAMIATANMLWAVVYVLIIRAGLRDRTYGMPIVALWLNLSWEGNFSFVRPQPGALWVTNVVWFLLDCGILWTALRYGHREFPWLPRWGYVLGLALTGACCWTGMEAALRQLERAGGIETAGTYTGFGAQLVMSCLFPAMLMARRSTSGQSTAIGVCRLVADAGAVAGGVVWLRNGTVVGGPVLPVVFTLAIVLDLAYVAGVSAVRRAERRVPAAVAPDPAAGAPVVLGGG
ncbi:hypothetical protein [Streptomyces sp. NRRL F-5123]|uniref:transmembrane-type terpene cyclase n=1 Tax=Streptomyces sp. NRRL F-5123 TaxID=1463856 RepID=UPI0006942BFA|nr:hypothetical protein [Streptomyces sp. NRRL F-5123]